MTHRELIAMLADRRGLSIETAKRGVAALLGACARSLAQGERVDVRRVGAFVLRPLKARLQLHPASRKLLRLPARRVPAFRPSACWLAAARGGGAKEPVEGAALGDVTADVRLLAPTAAPPREAAPA